MEGAFRIGKAFGIEIKVHWTFLLLLGFFGFVGYGLGDGFGGALVTVSIVLALFVCVLLHEFGHSLVAQRLGIRVPDITLLPIGGVARLEEMPEKPMDEVKIAVAGPVVNLVLAPMLLAGAYMLGTEPLAWPDLAVAAQGSFGEALAYLGFVNAFLVVFNLLPAFPMDGGRILRGLLATRLGALRATDAAANVGQTFAALFFIFGLVSGNLILALVAVFVYLGAGGEREMVRQRETTRGLTVAAVMGTKERTETVSPYHTYGQVLDSVVGGYQEDFPVVDEKDRLVGMLTRQEIFTAAHSPERYGTVRDLMLTEYPTVSPDANLLKEGLTALQHGGIPAVPVVEGGVLVGMLTVEDLAQANLLGRSRRKPAEEPVAPAG